jgi:hypothetical protein
VSAFHGSCSHFPPAGAAKENAPTYFSTEKKAAVLNSRRKVAFHVRACSGLHLHSSSPFQVALGDLEVAFGISGEAPQPQYTRYATRSATEKDRAAAAAAAAALDGCYTFSFPNHPSLVPLIALCRPKEFEHAEGSP